MRCPRVRGSLWWGGGASFIGVSLGCIVPILGCPHVGVSPCQGVPILGCPHTGVSPCWGFPMSGCPHVGVSPGSAVPPPPQAVTPLNPAVPPHRTRTGPGAAEQDGEIRPTQPAGRRQPPGGVHAAQPARYGTVPLGVLGVLVSLGVFGGHRSPQGTTWIQLRVLRGLCVHWGPWGSQVTPRDRLDPTTVLFGVFVSIGVLGGYR